MIGYSGSGYKGMQVYVLVIWNPVDSENISDG